MESIRNGPQDRVRLTEMRELALAYLGVSRLHGVNVNQAIMDSGSGGVKFK